MKPKKCSCPSEIQLSRALSVGADEQLRAHLANCEHCATEWAAMKRLIALGKQIEASAPSAERSEDLRTEILARSESLVREPMHGLVGWAVAAVCAGAVALTLIVALVRNNEPERVEKHVSVKTSVAEVRRGTIQPLGNARFARISSQPDEVIRLFDGSLSIKVEPLGPEERFRVMTSDAEVEVHGTVFEVTALDDRLAGVGVSRGRVAVRRRGGKAELLIAPARWEAVQPAGEEKITSNIDERQKPHAQARAQNARSHRRAALDLPLEKNKPATEAPVTADKAEPDQAELAFREGWSALRSGQPVDAAKAFQRVEQAEPPSTLAEDACFWRGVALKRAGQVEESMAELSSFIKRYPDSARAGEAATMLGWMLLKAGHPEAARINFEKGKDDSSDRVRASARKGLANTERR